jgi:hypothetical protein
MRKQTLTAELSAKAPGCNHPSTPREPPPSSFITRLPSKSSNLAIVSRWHHVRVRIHGHTDLSVTEQFLHHLWMRPDAQQERCDTVAQIMEPDVRQPCPLQQRFEHGALIRGSKWRTVRRTKHVITILPIRRAFPQRYLTLLMYSQSLNGK